MENDFVEIISMWIGIWMVLLTITGIFLIFGFISLELGEVIERIHNTRHGTNKYYRLRHYSSLITNGLVYSVGDRIMKGKTKDKKYAYIYRCTKAGPTRELNGSDDTWGGEAGDFDFVFEKKLKLTKKVRFDKISKRLLGTKSEEIKRRRYS